MNPIDKFTDVECIYNFIDQEEHYTEYVWRLAMFLKPDIEEDEPFECSYAVSVFKKRYNDRLIKMPLTYEEYIKNKDIQATLTGLKYDIDKFWFALLFIYDYCQGECFNSQEYDSSPYADLSSFVKIVNENLSNGTDPLKENINFSQDIKLEIKIANKVVHTIKTPNAIKYLVDHSKQCCEQLLDLANKGEYKNPMLLYKIKDELNIENQNYQIYLFTTLFKFLFGSFGMPKEKCRSRNGDVSFDRTFLISRLIFLTKISYNEEFLYHPSTLKGYISRYRDKGIKGKINRYYK